eukprot:scaffold12459_cov56-Attheya_sp.AAC.2
MIRTVREFREVADDLEFTEAQEKFTNFRKCLRDVARDDWDTAKVGQPNTIVGFDATMYQWKLMILPEDIYEAQKNYIETVKKPFTMSMHDFVKRIRQMASYLPDFPKPMTATALSETYLKSIIFRGMPNAWQENFVHANMRIASVTWAQMTDYLASEQVIADTQQDKTTKGRVSQGGRSSGYAGRGSNPGRGRGYQGQHFQAQGRGSSNGSFKRSPQVHGLVPQIVAMKSEMIPVGIMAMRTLGNNVMATLMDRIIVQGLRLELKEQQAVVVVDSVAAVEVIGMTPTITMPPLMQALIRMH